MIMIKQDRPGELGGVMSWDRGAPTQVVQNAHQARAAIIIIIITIIIIIINC